MRNSAIASERLGLGRSPRLDTTVSELLRVPLIHQVSAHTRQSLHPDRRGNTRLSPKYPRSYAIVLLYSGCTKRHQKKTTGKVRETTQEY